MRVLKNVTRCKDCNNRVLDIGVGFASSPKLLCSMNGMEVDEYDGCTFGYKGEGGYARRENDVAISGHEAVFGC